MTGQFMPGDRVVLHADPAKVGTVTRIKANGQIIVAMDGAAVSAEYGPYALEHA